MTKKVAKKTALKKSRHLKSSSSHSLASAVAKKVPIHPLTLEEFFGASNIIRTVTVSLQRDAEGGYRAQVNYLQAFGDTPGEALRAIYDYLTGVNSRRARLNPPFYPADRQAHNWGECRRVEYDYRERDFIPPR